MPRIQPDAKEILTGAHDGVRVVLDDGEPLVTLAGRNMIADPLFEDFDMGGRLKNWTLGAPARPDGYHVYMRHYKNAAGNVLGSTFLQRQNTATYPFGRNSHVQFTPLIEGPGIPDANKQARIPGPDRAPRVSVEQMEQVVGLRSGRYRIAIAWILGNYKHSRRITGPSPVSYEDVAQGRWLRVFFPESAPEGVGGLALLVAHGNGPLRIQARYPVPLGEYGNVTQYRNTADVVDSNETYVAPVGKYGPPRVWFPRAAKTRVLYGGRYRLSYRLVTDTGASEAGEGAGESASQQTYDQIRALRSTGRVMAFAPPKNALAQEGVIGWYPEMIGTDGQWYILKRTGARPWLGINDRAEVTHRPSSNVQGLHYGWAMAEQNTRNLEDYSGIPDPDAGIESSGQLGMERLPPGEYATRATFAIGEQESAPSPPRVVTLRDAGEAAGGPATGVSDQIIRVHAPVENSIPNDRFADKRPDGLDLDWETPPVPDVLVESGDGILRVTDTSRSTEDATVRICERFPIDTDSISVLKMYIVHFGEFYEGGSWGVRLLFYDEDVNWVGGRVLSQFQTWQRFWLKKRIGPWGSGADIPIPPTATHANLHLVNFGHMLTGSEDPSQATTPSQRWLQYEVSSIGLFRGSAPNKRYPINFGLYSDSDIPDRVSPDTPRPELPYPPGAYCRVVTDPVDPANTPSREYIHSHRFEGGLGVGWSFIGTPEVSTQAALRGERGLIARRNQGIRYTSGATDKLAARAIVLPYGLAEDLAPTATTTIGRINGTDEALVQLVLWPHGVLALRVKHGSESRSVSFLYGIEPHSEITVEMIAAGANSTSGHAKAIVVMDGVRYPEATFENLDWRGQHITSADYGPTYAPVGFEAYVDHVFISEDGMSDTDVLPGSYVEYWAPPRTPYSRNNFLYGYRQPIAPGRHTVSAHLGSQNITKRAELLPTVVLDEDGNVLLDNGPLVSLVGDNDWERHHLTFEAPEGAAYLEFIGGLVADGLIRAQAPQLEENGLTNFSWTFPPEGYFTTTLDTQLPGGSPRPELEAARSFEALDAVTTNEDATTVTLSVRAGDTLDEMDSAIWRSSIQEVLDHEGVRRYVQIHCLLSTADLTQTPGVRSLFLDLKRQFPTLLRADGSEFLSGCEAPMFSAPQPVRNLIEREYADGSTGVEDIGRREPRPVLEGLTLRCWRDSAAREIAWLQGYGDSLFILETPETEKAISFHGATFELEHPRLKEAESEDGFYLLEAEVERAEIIHENDSGAEVG